MKQWTALILTFFLAFNYVARADTGGYTVEPHAPRDGLIDSRGADATVTFWELPMWIQIAWISGLIFAFLGSFKILPLVSGGFKRILRSNALDNKNRLSMYTFIKRNPGVYFRELISELKINKGTAEYHLKILEMAGLITSVQNKAYKRYFLNNSTFSSSEQAVLSALRENMPRKILLTLLKNPGLSHREIATAIGISRPTVVSHMKTMAKNGIVKSEHASVTLKHHISPEILLIVQKYI